MGTLGGIPFEVGDVLAKKYRLERLVGEGGTGLVVAARHLQLERVVAIKFLRTALASEEIRTRFEREANAIRQIESEHVVLVLDVGALPDDSPYMVMEYLEGRDLAKIVKEDGPLSVSDAVDCALQVCEALEEAHNHGIVHRDLKPANLFLTRREDGGPHVKVVDFGISKVLDPKILSTDKGGKDMTAAFTVLGSPRYMAPEQLRSSKDVDGRADLWSLGAVLFLLVTGKPAFDAENNIHVSLAVITKEAPLLRSLAPHAPRELEMIVNKCLTKDRAGRFQTAAELADALRPLASDRTRESLERLQQAKELPSLNIAIGVTTASQNDLGGTPSSQPTPPAPAVQSGLTVPLHPPSAPRWMPDYAPDSAPRTPRRPLPPSAMRVGLAVGGVLVVLLAFGLFTVLKMAAQSMGVLPSASAGPTFPAAPSLPAVVTVQGPSTAVTVTLDAGRPPP